MELALLHLDIKQVLQQPFENLAHVLSVYLKGWRIDEHIIEVHKDKLVNHVSQHAIDHALEDSRGVSEPEGKDQVFIVSRGGIDVCLPLITLVNADKMIGVAELWLSEDLGSLQEFKGQTLKARGTCF